MSSENYFISEQLETGLARVKIKDTNMGIAPRLQKLSQCESAPECDSCVCKINFWSCESLQENDFALTSVNTFLVILC